MEAERLRTILRHLTTRHKNETLGMRMTSAEESVEVGATEGQFRYTMDNPRLTSDQRKFYEDNGFIVIRKLVAEDLLDECRERFVDICEGRFSKGEMILMKDVSYAKNVAKGVKGEYLYNKLQDIIWDDVLSKYILTPEILDYVECFTGPNIMAMHTMLINKPPDSGKRTSRHPLHQDLHYFAFRPADRIVASWTAMEQVTSANGCLCVIPGSHKGTLLPHEYPKMGGQVNKAFHGVQGYDGHPLSLLEMEKGDTVFFHPILIHGSGINTTQGCRKAISCHYASSECHYIDVTGTTQENIADEVKAVAKRRGLDMDYKTFWSFRNRLVRGKTVNL